MANSNLEAASREAGARAAIALKNDKLAGLPTSLSANLGLLTPTSFIYDPAMDDRKLPDASRFFLAGSKIIGDKAAPVQCGDLVIVIDDFATVGIGRISDGVVSSSAGVILVGEPVKIVSIIW